MHGILDTQRIKQTTGLLLLASIIVIPWATPAGATIFWDDEMESGTGSPYDNMVSGGVASYDASIKFSGAGSTKVLYPSNCLPQPPACGGFFDRPFTPVSTRWTRFYIRLSPDFQISEVQTKVMRSDTNGPESSWWGFLWGTPNWTVQVQVPNVGTRNIHSSATLNRGQWYCVEMRETLNTPGVSNGIIESWLDGTLILSVSDVLHRISGDNSLLYNNRMYRQVGSGNIWYDRIAVGDQRIGCLGSVSNGDDTPPRIPTGLTLR